LTTEGSYTRRGPNSYLRLTPQEERIWWEGRRVQHELKEAAYADEGGGASADPRYRRERDQRKAETMAEIEAEQGEPVTTVSP
jgi:hypothetical protein